MAKDTKMSEDKYHLPQGTEDLYSEAKGLSDQNKQEPARRILLGLLERFPKEPRILMGIGNTYLSEGDNIDKAERYYLKALEYAPDFAPLLCNISGLYSKIGRYDESGVYARRAIAADPGVPSPWRTLGLQSERCYFTSLNDPDLETLKEHPGYEDIEAEAKERFK